MVEITFLKEKWPTLKKMMLPQITILTEPLTEEVAPTDHAASCDEQLQRSPCGKETFVPFPDQASTTQI